MFSVIPSVHGRSNVPLGFWWVFVGFPSSRCHSFYLRSSTYSGFPSIRLWVTDKMGKNRILVAGFCQDTSTQSLGPSNGST